MHALQVRWCSADVTNETDELLPPIFWSKSVYDNPGSRTSAVNLSSLTLYFISLSGWVVLMSGRWLNFENMLMQRS